MKKILTILLICYSFNSLYSQCIADAGPDKIICTTTKGIEPNQIGSAIPVKGGKPPYTYKWETEYKMALGTHTYIKTASYFLNDTTLANPSIIQAKGPLTFKLTVTDADGVSCVDSTLVRFSTEFSTLATLSFSINSGDSVLLNFGTNVTTNFPPFTYLWKPNHGLTDSTHVVFYAKPTVSTAYYVTVTDSAGCVVVGGSYYFVGVNPTGIGAINSEKVEVSLFPNPSKDCFQMNVTTKQNDLLLIEFFDEKGASIRKVETQSKSLQLQTNLFPKGIIFYKVSGNNRLLGQGKFIVE